MQIQISGPNFCFERQELALCIEKQLHYTIEF